jgi:hypothetical protein
MNIMRKIISCFFISFLMHQSLYAQNKLPEISLNHIYVVLDSMTYNHLFDSSFIEQKIGNVKAASVTTTEDSWSGKYLFGKNSYFEFFSIKSFEGATVGDGGLGFMTLKSGDIKKIEKHWKESTADSIQTDTTSNVSNGKTEPWFYSISLSLNDSIQPFSTWIMENTPEELKSVGFSDKEIKSKITWQQYAEKRNKKLFTKCFGHIQTVSLSLTDTAYENIKKSFAGFGLKQKNNTFFNEHVKIICSIEEHPPHTIQQIEIKLTQAFEEQTIKISNHLSVQIHGDKATWVFK